MKYLEILDIFDEDISDAYVLSNQKSYIKSLEDMLKHLTILETRNEEEAEPELHYIIKFLKYLLECDNFMETISKYEMICQFLLETFFVKSCSIIIKSRFFNSNKILHLCNQV